MISSVANYAGSLRVYRDVYPSEFVPSSEALENQNKVKASGKIADFWDLLRHEFPDGREEGELNEFIEMEYDYYADRIGLVDEEEKQKAISALSDIGLYFEEEYYDDGYYVIRFQNCGFDLELYDLSVMSIGFDNRIVFDTWRDAIQFSCSVVAAS